MCPLKTKLRTLKQTNVKPNYLALFREYSMVRHAVKQMYEGLDPPQKERKRRFSGLDEHLADEPLGD